MAGPHAVELEVVLVRSHMEGRLRLGADSPLEVRAEGKAGDSVSARCLTTQRLLTMPLK